MQRAATRAVAHPDEHEQQVNELLAAACPSRRRACRRCRRSAPRSPVRRDAESRERRSRIRTVPWRRPARYSSRRLRHRRRVHVDEVGREQALERREVVRDHRAVEARSAQIRGTARVRHGHAPRRSTCESGPRYRSEPLAEIANARSRNSLPIDRLELLVHRPRHLDEQLLVLGRDLVDRHQRLEPRQRVVDLGRLLLPLPVGRGLPSPPVIISCSSADMRVPRASCWSR